MEETHCFEYDTRHKENVFNYKVTILDEEIERHEFQIHRKCYHKCGEITGSLVPILCNILKNKT